MSTRRHGFTLIELLVVIVIIAVLAALLLTGISGAMRMAKRVKASTEVKGLQAALMQYYNEYHRYPTTTTPDPENEAVKISGNLARMLQGENIPAGNNIKLLPFVVFQALANGDVTKPINPWFKGGTPTDDNYYWCKFDFNFNNSIQGTGDSNAPPFGTIKRQVIVWTKDVDRSTPTRTVWIQSWDD